MARRLIDISVPWLENDVASDPPASAPTIEYLDHKNTPPQIADFFPGLKEEDLPDGAGLGGRARCICRPTTARISTRPIISIRR